MLRITIPAKEMWDEQKRMFFESKEQTLQLEHSLVSISKWESKWQKPFLTNSKKTIEETVCYIRCMTITQNVDSLTYSCVTNDIIEKVNAYIENKMTATWFSEKKQGLGSSEQITSELIYYWMTAYNIPFECQKWHLNRLLTLIRICGVKNEEPKKRSTKEMIQHRRELNEARKKANQTKG